MGAAPRCRADGRLPLPTQEGRTRVGGIDIGTPRMRTVLSAVLSLAAPPHGFTADDLAAKVKELAGPALSDDDARRAAYDLKKLRGKALLTRLDRSHRYQLLPEGVPVITALVVLREKVLKPLLAALAHPLSDPIRPKPGRKPRFWRPIDDHDQALRLDLHALLRDLHVVSHRQSFVDGAFASA